MQNNIFSAKIIFLEEKIENCFFVIKKMTMRILFFKNSQNPIGIKGLGEGEKLPTLKLFGLPMNQNSKYTIAQIRDCHQQIF